MKKKVEKFISALACLVFVLSSAIPAARAEETVIHITDTSGWEEFASACRLDRWSEGVTVELDADLELPEGVSVPTFGGTFHGNGHILRQLNLTGGGDVQGLFRYLRAGAVVEDLILSGSVLPDGKAKEIGALAGSSSGTVRRCSFQGVVSGTDTVGGLVGVNETDGRIEDCTVGGVISGEHFTGGIAGENWGSILRCKNNAAVNTKEVTVETQLEEADLEHLNSTENMPAATDTGGIAGYSGGLLQSCVNEGLIGYSHVGYNVGGIAGRQAGQMSDCTNGASVRGRKDVGGVVGQAEPYKELRYQKTLVQKLGEELNTLSGILDGAIDETSGSRRTVSAHLDTLLSLTDDAREHTSVIRDELEAQSDGTVDTVNDLSDRIAGILDDAHPISREVSEAFGELDDASVKLNEAVNAFTPTDAQQENMKQALLESLDNLRTAADRYEAAKLQLKLHPEDPEAQQEVLTAQRGVVEALSPVQQETQAWAERVKDPLGKALLAMSRAADKLSSALGDLSGLIDHQRRLPPLKLPKTSKKLHEAQDALSGTLAGFRDEMDALHTSLDAAGDTLDRSLHRINAQFSAIARLLRDFGNEEAEDPVVDLSDEKIEQATGGRLQDCRNFGRVDGDVNVGGIAGAVAIEYDFDPEDDAEENGGRSLRFQYLTRAVLHSCVNRGNVTARKNCAGGIAGRMDLGVVMKCRGFGAVASTNGEQVGGIAGQSSSVVRGCWAKCRLSGQRAVGGIVGSGRDIQDCRALVRIDRGNSCLGAVAGETDGELRGNLFLGGELGGVDGISYAGKAAPAAWEEFSGLAELPPEFEKMRVAFVTDTAGVRSLLIPYGQSIPRAEIPAVPEKSGFVGTWENFEKNHVCFDETIHAVYTPLQSTVSTPDGSFLAEGSFSFLTRLRAEERSGAALPDGRRVLGSWKVYLANAADAFTALRVRLPEGVRRPELWVLEDGSWRKLASTEESSYLRAELSTTAAEIALAEAPVSVLPVLVGACAGALAPIWVARQRKKKKSFTEEKT